jgi:hypothetical protein
LTILSNGEISSSTFGFGNSGSVAVDVSGELMIDATSANTRFLTGIAAEANGGSSGNAGTVQVSAGSLAISNGGGVSTSNVGPRRGRGRHRQRR